jgi:O-antigen/teichoic acid export membrane protein
VIKNTLKLAASNGGGSAIMLLALPFLARMYDPDAFGLQAFFISIMALFLPISSLKCEFAIVTSKTAAESRQTVKLCSLISLGISVIMGSIIFLLSQTTSWLFSPDTQLWLIILVAINFFLDAQIIIYGKYALSKKFFNYIAIAGLLKPLILVVYAVVSYAIIGTDQNALVIGFFTASVVSLSLYAPLVFDVYTLANSEITYRDLAKKNRNFFTFGAIGSFFNGIATNAPQIMIGSAFGTDVLGLVAIAIRVLSIPMKTIGAALNFTFFSETKHLQPGPELRTVSVRTLELTCLAIASLIAITLMSDEILVLLLGDEWAGVGAYFNGLLFLYLAWSLTMPLSSIFSSLGKQKQLCVLQFWKLVIRIGSLWLASVVIDDVILALTVYAVISGLSQIVQVIASLRLADGTMSDLWRVLLVYLGPITMCVMAIATMDIPLNITGVLGVTFACVLINAGVFTTRLLIRPITVLK